LLIDLLAVRGLIKFLITSTLPCQLGKFFYPQRVRCRAATAIWKGAV